jgi:GNAT superfamily N-acetyltransferase
MKGNGMFGIEKNPSEQKETLEFEILNTKELEQIIYQGERIPQDKRFLSVEEGGVFRYFSIKDFLTDCLNLGDCIFPIAKINGLIVGLVTLQKSPYKEQEDIIWVSGIDVDSKFRDRKIGKLLVEKIFQYADDNNLTLQLSSYTIKDNESRSKIRGITKKMMEKYDKVKVLDSFGRAILN